MKAILFISLIFFCAAETEKAEDDWADEPEDYNYLTAETYRPIRISRCWCYENGNYYSPVSAGGCTQFKQQTRWLPAATHNCPAGLQFDLNTCVCNWPYRTYCPANCQPTAVTPPNGPSCQQNGNTYAPVPGTNCQSFTQSTATLPPVRHNCPAGLQFDVNECVCNWPHRTNCSV